MASQVLNIGSRLVGVNCPTFIIAEIGQAHDGSLGAAHAYIDAVAKTGVDAVKFQTHIAHAESTPTEKFRVNVFPQDATRYDYWRRMEFTTEQWAGLAEHARDSNLLFLSTPFSLEAVDLLEKIGVPAWKIGSGDTSNFQLLERVASTNLPLLLSSGMSSWNEIDESIACVKRFGSEFALMQCTTSYPCPPEKLGLNILNEIQARYSCVTGLSDHSGTIFASMAAVPLGASIIEVHATFSKQCFGPDVSSSVTIEELSELVRGVRFIWQALSNPVSKDVEAKDLEHIKLLFGRSLVAARPLQSNTQLQRDDFAFRKPGTGISANRLEEFLGRVLINSVSTNHFFSESDFLN
jgi:N,N'-diacetyllegionaminate synthase